MAEINGRTLMMAVQAVNAKIRGLSQEIENAQDDADLINLEDLLLAYSKAADDLRDAYRTECEFSSNLPPYEKLVPFDD